ncbi:MAG: site-specific integrase [Acidimicrobiia bacterium]
MATNKRRPQGQGSIFYRADKDRWVGSIDISEDGQRRRRSVTGHTKKEVAAKLDDLRKELDQHGTVAAADLTFRDLFTAWIDTAAPAKVQPSTVANYRTLAEKHLLPTLGNRQVGKLQPADLERVLRMMSKDGYRRSTLVHVRQVGSQVLDWAVRRRQASWNPFKIAEIPPNAAPARQRESLTVDEVRRVIDAAAEHRNGALLTVGITTGLRPGELTALTWASIDLDGGTLHVWQAWKGAGDDRVLAEPKTKGSARTVALPPVTIDALRQHRQVWAEERLAGLWSDEHTEHGGLVFVTEAGTPIDPANLRRLFRYVARDADLDKLTPYMLRHTATSLLADAGVPNEAIADVLGHRTTRMVELHYRHRLKPSVDAAAGPMQELLG